MDGKWHKFYLCFKGTRIDNFGFFAPPSLETKRHTWNMDPSLFVWKGYKNLEGNIKKLKIGDNTLWTFFLLKQQ